MMKAALMCTAVLSMVFCPSWTATILKRHKRQGDHIGVKDLNCVNSIQVTTPILTTTSLGILRDTDSQFTEECRRWAGTATPTDHVKAIKIKSFNTLPDGTVEYQAEICCKETLTTQDDRCFTCASETTPFDCNYNNPLASCSRSQDGSCFITYTCEVGQNTANISKGCVTSATQCQASCGILYFGDTCTQCCTDHFCNFDPSPKSCYSRGDNVTPGDIGNTCQHEGFPTDPGCCCLPGYSGDECQHETGDCSKDCQNQGSCKRDSNNNEHCVCPDGFLGDLCETPVDFDCTDDDLVTNIHVTTGSTCANVLATDLSLTQELGRCRYDMKERFGLASVFNDGVDGQADEVYNIAYSGCYGTDSCASYSYRVCCPSCHSIPCQNGGYCMQRDDGSYVCKCRLGYSGPNCENELATCRVYGEPHFIAFGGQAYSYQGSEAYWLVRLSSQIAGSDSFEVIIKHEFRDGVTSVTYPSYIEIIQKSHGTTHTIRLDKSNIVLVNGQVVNVDAHYDDFKIINNGRFVHYEADFGLVVEFDGDYTAVVMVPMNYKGQLSGLCGDIDVDEFIDCDGVLQTDDVAGHTRYGDSCCVTCSDTTDIPTTSSTPPSCTDTQKALYRTNDYCGHIVNPNGPFSSCIANTDIDTVIYLETCAYDLCIDESLKCRSLESFVTVCQSNVDPDWRSIVNCPMTCGSNSRYEFSVSPCQPTCEEPMGLIPCPLQHTEVCVCETGYIVRDDECVLASECGCKHNNIRYKIGDTFDINDLGDGTCETHTCVDCQTCNPPAKVEVTIDSCDDSTAEPTTASCPSSSFDPLIECTNRCKGVKNPCSYIADPCDCNVYYQCDPNSIYGYHKRTCSPCMCWDADAYACVRDPEKEGDCPTVTVDPIPCNLLPVANDKTRFWLGYNKLKCPSATIFSQDECTCVPGGPLYDKALGCFTFDEPDYTYSSLYGHFTNVYESLNNGKRGGAAEFRGNSRVEIPMFSQWEGTQLSISFWYQRTDKSETGRMALVSNQYGGIGASIQIVSESQSTVGGGMRTKGPGVQGTIGAFTAETATFGVWHHVVLVYNGGKLLFYLDDDSPKEMTAFGFIEKRPCPLYLGSYFEGDYFTGLMDEVCFYGKALTTDEVAKLKSGPIYYTPPGK